MDVLKIATAGSVDDGKSTLIGRLLFDTNSLPEDKIEAIRKSSEQNGYDYLDFSLATDGLVAERQQGITIDVAHIYFSTPKRSYIIADTPGHVEYTRNMVTGASTSQLAIILIDARKGVTEQTYRHFFINILLRVKEVVIAVNKMDLVGYSEAVYDDIQQKFEALNAKSTYKSQRINFIPVSALKGDNVVQKTNNMPWYKGDTLLQYLEQSDMDQFDAVGRARFPIQSVIRPKTADYHDFRGFSGKIYNGSLRVGDAVTVLPSLKQTKVKAIYFYDKSFDEVKAGSTAKITLEDEVNISRGDMLVLQDELPTIKKELTATVCWMDNKELRPGTKYILQHHTNRIISKIDAIHNEDATDFSGQIEANNKLAINEIGEVSIKLSKPIFCDCYAQNKSNGAFILIDEYSNTTAGVGFIK